MPSLWTRIPLLTPDMKYTTNPSFLELYTDFLLRSAGQPLGVFVSSHDAKAENAVKWHPAVKILVSHSYRWQHLSVVRTPFTFSVPYVPLKNGSRSFER